jgi:hypothetical protein
MARGAFAAMPCGVVFVLLIYVFADSIFGFAKPTATSSWRALRVSRVDSGEENVVPAWSPGVCGEARQGSVGGPAPPASRIGRYRLGSAEHADPSAGLSCGGRPCSSMRKMTSFRHPAKLVPHQMPPEPGDVRRPSIAPPKQRQ